MEEQQSNQRSFASSFERQQTSIQPEMPQSKSGLSVWASILISILVIIILGGGGYWAYQYFFMTEPDKEDVDEMADWQVYRDEEHGFEIKYPTDWRKEPCNPDFPSVCVGFYPSSKERTTIVQDDRFVEYVGDIFITFGPLKGNSIEGIEKFYRTMYPEYTNLKYIKIAEEKALAFYNIEGILKVDIISIPLKPGAGYIEITGLSEQREVLEQIISSFRLIIR